MTTVPALRQRPLAVIFDMDGLMLDTESLGPRTWEGASRASGIPFDLALLPAMIGLNHRDSRAFLLRHYGDAYPVDALGAACLTHFDAIIAAEGIAVKPGVRELAAWLDESGIPRAVATSTRHERAKAQLTALGLFAGFATLVGGDEVANGKPAPDIFLEAAARLRTPVERCVVLEDSQHGVRAALAAGIAPIMVPDQVQPPAELVAAGLRVLPSLHEVRSLLASLAP